MLVLVALDVMSASLVGWRLAFRHMRQLADNSSHNSCEPTTSIRQHPPQLPVEPAATSRQLCLTTRASQQPLSANTRLSCSVGPAATIRQLLPHNSYEPTTSIRQHQPQLLCWTCGYYPTTPVSQLVRANNLYPPTPASAA